MSIFPAFQYNFKGGGVGEIVLFYARTLASLMEII